MPIQTKKYEIEPQCEVKPKIFKIEVLSINLEYNANLLPMRSSAKPFDFFDRSSQIDRKDVTWYFSKIKADLIDEGKKSQFSLPHWYIRTNNPQLFNFMNKMYTNIDLIFGQEKTYWKFTRRTDNGLEEIQEGETILNVGTCSCCIDTDYPRIIEALKNQLQKS